MPEHANDVSEIRRLSTYSPLATESDKEIVDQWTKFSDLRVESWTEVNPETVEKFDLWLSTGDDNDAL
jgi:hypothetical protein